MDHIILKYIYRYFFTAVLVLTTTPDGLAQNKKPNQDKDAFDLIEESMDIEADRKDAKESQFMKNPMKFLERKKRQIADKVVVVSSSLDSVFGGNYDYLNQKNPSRINITAGQLFQEYENPIDIFDLSVRIILPNTEKRFQLLLDTINEDIKGRLKSPLTAQQRDKNLQNKDYVAGLGYVPLANKYLNLSLVGGIKLVWPLQPFARIRARNTFGLANKVQLRIAEEVSWFNQEGWSSDTTAAFERPFSEGRLLSFSNDIRWQDIWDFAELTHTLSFFQPLKDSKSITYWLGSFGKIDRGVYVDSYGLGFSYKMPIYKDWVLLSLSPSGRWAREDNFTYRSVFEIKSQIIISKW